MIIGLYFPSKYLLSFSALYLSVFTSTLPPCTPSRLKFSSYVSNLKHHFDSRNEIVSGIFPIFEEVVRLGETFNRNLERDSICVLKDLSASSWLSNKDIHLGDSTQLSFKYSSRSLFLIRRSSIYEGNDSSALCLNESEEKRWTDSRDIPSSILL